MSKDINPILDAWPADDGVVRARRIVTPKGEAFIQLRIDLGLLQMRLEGRPDGERLHGHDSMLAYLQARSGPGRIPVELSEDEKEEIVREMLQYYRRRVSLIALADQAKRNKDLKLAEEYYQRAIDDADHNLAMLDILVGSCTDAEFAADHEQYRPFILMHRTACVAERALLATQPDIAIETLKQGADTILDLLGVNEMAAEQFEPDEQYAAMAENHPFVSELKRMERSIRREYRRPKTLQEQLTEALDREEYERAASLRDAIAKQPNLPL